MWKCRICGQNNADEDRECGFCTDDLPENEATKNRFLEEEGLPNELRTTDNLACLRCKGKMQSIGIRRFHEGGRWGFFGDLGELFVHRESFEIFACCNCGKVEFFALDLKAPGEEP